MKVTKNSDFYNKSLLSVFKDLSAIPFAGNALEAIFEHMDWKEVKPNKSDIK